MNQRKRNDIDIAILCPIELEYNTVWKKLQNPVSLRIPRLGIPYELGQINRASKSWNTALFETGSDIASTQEKTSLIIYSLKPTYIFLVGIAGGIKDVKKGDVVVANQAFNYERGKESEDSFERRLEMENHTGVLLDYAKQLAREYQREDDLSINVFLGPIASGNKVITARKSATAQLIKEINGNTLAVEMESIGFAKAVRKAGIEGLNIRGISDLLDNKIDTESDGSRELAAQNALEFLLKLLDAIVHHKNGSLALAKYASEPLIERVRVRYRSTPYRSLFHPRFAEKGVLHFYSNKIELKGAEDALEIQEVLAVERVKMPGDVSASWVKVHFQEGIKKKVLFFSDDVRLPGWDRLVGGGEALCEIFEDYLKN